MSEGLEQEIAYRPIGSDYIGVRLDGKLVGSIRYVNGGYQYFPLGQKRGGEVFKTLRECKYSLEEDDDL